MTEHIIAAATIVASIASATIAWLANEWSKRRAEAYERRERMYSALVESLPGFYVSTNPVNAQQLKTTFLGELNKCWLYCPDEVILSAYAFMDSVHTDVKHSDEEKERRLGAFMLAIRRDLISRKPLKATQLEPKDFKRLVAT